jgi:hypothetical protein
MVISPIRRSTEGSEKWKVTSQWKVESEKMWGYA